jgi:hypothetical protein
VVVTSSSAQIRVNGRPVAPEQADELVCNTLRSSPPTP